VNLVEREIPTAVMPRIVSSTLFLIGSGQRAKLKGYHFAIPQLPRRLRQRAVQTLKRCGKSLR